MRAPRRKTIAGALFAGLFLAAIALAGNNLSGTSTRSAALNVSHVSGPVSQFASSTGPPKGTPAAPSKGANPQGMTVGRSYKNAISPSVRSLGRSHGTGQLQARPELPPLFTGKPLRQANDPVVQSTMPKSQMPAPIFNFEGIDSRASTVTARRPTRTVTSASPSTSRSSTKASRSSTSPRASLGPVVSHRSGRASAAVCENFGHGDPVVSTTRSPTAGWSTQFAGNNPSEPSRPVHRRVDHQRRDRHIRRYDFKFADNFYDYPKFGVWPDAYYISMDIFDASGNRFLGPEAYRLRSAAMLAGNPATFVTAPMGSPSDDSYMPADLDGPTPPPAGAPNPYLSMGVLPPGRCTASTSTLRTRINQRSTWPGR